MLVGAAISLALAAGVQAATTLERTIQDTDGDNLLEYAPGEAYTVVGAPVGFRPPKRGSLLNFLQLSDFQAVDEESPARVEFLDTTQRVSGLNPFSAAYRPQESLTTQIVEAMVREVRAAKSAITGRRPGLSILTGDNADSQQYNETRWFIDILDGGVQVNPDSGVPAGPCTATPGSVYDGVRGGGPGIGYYEPDASAGQDGDGYSPDRGENMSETGRDVTVRDFPTLLERANQPFSATGLGMPWYSAFGNHDALIQGNSSEAYVGPFDGAPEQSNPAMQTVATGCAKPTVLPTQYGGDPDAYMSAYAADPQGTVNESAPMVVPPDSRRCFLAKDERFGGGAPPPCASGGWIQQHFSTRGMPVGHGFANRPGSAVANHDGYYAFNPAANLRFIVLDTITDECGAPVCAEGSVDEAQFQWLRSEIEAAKANGRYVMVFAHHTLRTIRFPGVDLTEDPLHYGQRVDRRGGNPQNPGTAMTLEELFCAHPRVLAFIAGHEHENYTERHACAADAPPTPGPGEFWQVSTAAHIDWPQQSRMIELFDNGDGTLSLVLTMIDHAAPPRPGASSASGGALGLASIGRELAYNDYQGSRAARGTPADRNLIVVMDAPG